MSTLLTRALGARVAERCIRPSAGVSAIPAAELGSVHKVVSRAVRALGASFGPGVVAGGADRTESVGSRRVLALPTSGREDRDG
jgi:hypothetical protein